MTKRAFVVGINDYHNWSNAAPLSFPSLQFCAADAASFANLLTTGFGFAADDIILCQDAEATLQALLGGLTQLLAPCQPGDVACFYFAGLGGRVPQNGWGVKSDKYYDALVPYDGSGMLMDYQLLALAQSLLPSGGVNLTVILDTSHAGTPAAAMGARAFGWSAEMIASCVANCRTVIPLIALADTDALSGNISAPARADKGVTMSSVPAKDTTPEAAALLLAAADYGEVASESSNQHHGYLTNALLEVANQANFQASPSNLLAALRQKVAGYSGGHQTPQLRGRTVGAQDIFLG